MRMRGLQETQFSARHKGLGRVFTLDFFGRGGGRLTYRRSYFATFPTQHTLRLAYDRYDHTRTRSSHGRPHRISVSSGYGWRARAQANERPNAHPPWQRVQVPPSQSGTPIPSLPAPLDQRGSVRGYQVHSESMNTGSCESVMHSTQEQLRRVLGQQGGRRGLCCEGTLLGALGLDLHSDIPLACALQHSAAGRVNSKQQA